MQRRATTTWAVWLAGLALVASSGCVFGEEAPGRWSRETAALRAMASCNDLAEELRARTLAEMNATLDEYEAMAKEWGQYGCWMAEDGGGPVAGGGTTPPSGSDSASEYSETNNQVAGVDEADFVKNDGAYVYILADGRFQIVDAWPADQAHRVAAVDIEGTPTKLFVHADRAVVYSSLPGSTGGSVDSGPWGYYGEPGGSSECTYGYDCEMTGDGHPMKITVLDISDRANPVLERETTFTGSFLAARRIGDAVHTVVAFPERLVPGLSYWPEDLWDCQERTPEEIEAIFEALRAENTRLIQEASTADWIPSAVDTLYTGGVAHTREGVLTDCTGYYASADGDGSAFLSVVSMDPSRHDPLAAVTVVGRPGFVYGAADALYVAARQAYPGEGGWYFADPAENPEASTVHEFLLTSQPYPRATYSGSGVVKGRVLNQFSMDRFDGRLRIATTTGHVPSPDVHSTITVLEKQGPGLVEVGRLDQIAPTEDIRSVRFDGERGFIVTFKKTDPLFVLDLADPTAPSIAGELKIPGFSTYMHLMDEDHLLTIGYDADDQGSFAWFQGVMLQIFDVSDPANPALTHKEIIGTRGSTSEATTNHLAFNYFAQKDLLAIPMTVCEGADGGGSYGDLMTFSGLMVYRVTPSSGFSYLGGVEHQTPETPESYWGACGNWWTQSSSLVQRSIFMDDFVYSITPAEIRVDAVDGLGTDLAVVDLTAP